MASKIPQASCFQRFCEMLALTRLVIFLHPGKAKPHPLVCLQRGDTHGDGHMAEQGWVGTAPRDVARWAWSPTRSSSFQLITTTKSEQAVGKLSGCPAHPILPSPPSVQLQTAPSVLQDQDRWISSLKPKPGKVLCTQLRAEHSRFAQAASECHHIFLLP